MSEHITGPVIARVTESRTGQRRITIPKETLGILKGDWVEIRRVEFASTEAPPRSPPVSSTAESAAANH